MLVDNSSITTIFLFEIQINHVELSPNYAGTLMGLTGAIANTAGFISPYVAGVVVEGNVSQILLNVQISTSI